MIIDFDTNFNDAKNLEELKAKLNIWASNLLASLQSQPNFVVNLDPEGAIPLETPTGTVIFQLSAGDAVSVGIYTGSEVIT